MGSLTEPPPITVAVIEDQANLRSHFVDVIDNAEYLSLCWQAGSLEDARKWAQRTLPNVALIDLGLPDGNGAQLIELFAQGGQTKTLVVTVFDDRASVRRAISSGADGYLVKDSEPSAIVDAIETLVAGGAPISASAAIHLLGLVRGQPQATQARRDTSGDVPQLTVREVQLLELFAKGLTYRETADCLNLSRHTVADYVKSIYRKLDVSSRSEAVFEAVHFNLIKFMDED